MRQPVARERNVVLDAVRECERAPVERRSVDSDLASLCGDSRCAVRFVPDQQAPPLLDYLTDAAKVDAPPWGPDAASRQALCSRQPRRSAATSSGGQTGPNGIRYRGAGAI